MNTGSGAPAVEIGDRRPDIQGIRALAVLMVVAHHAGLPLPGGFAGPDVFFTVSGFVITGLLLRERLASGRIALGSFYLRRTRRLLPALAVVTVATLVLAALVLSPIGPDQTVAGDAARAATTISANIYFLRQTGGYFQPVAQKNPFLHTWSLSVEEQFYLAFPLVLVGVWAVERRVRGAGQLAMAVLGLGGLASLGLGATLSYARTTPGWTGLAALTGSLRRSDAGLRGGPLSTRRAGVLASSLRSVRWSRRRGQPTSMRARSCARHGRGVPRFSTTPSSTGTADT